MKTYSNCWLIVTLLLVAVSSKKSFSQEVGEPPNPKPFPFPVTLLGYIETEQSVPSGVQSTVSSGSVVVVMLKIEDQIILLKEGEKKEIRFVQKGIGSANTVGSTQPIPFELRFDEKLDLRNKSLKLGIRPFRPINCELGNTVFPSVLTENKELPEVP